MNYEDRVVCFLDILGFSTQIQRTVDAKGNDETSRIAVIAAALQGIRDTLDTDRPEERTESEVTQFSDSIVISFQAGAESGVFYALRSILWVQINLVLRGLLCRGAITRGKLIHTPKLLFGPAMIEAYNLESKAALYPRVILSESIIEAGALAHAHHHRAAHEIESILNLLQRDSDGMYFVDYVTGAQSELDDPDYGYPEYVHHLRNVIAEGLESRDAPVRVKYGWLKERFVPHLTALKAAAETDTDDTIRKAYQSIPNL